MELEEKLRKFSGVIRKRTLHMVHKANSSHVGSCFSIADILATLYISILKIDPNNPNWSKRDRFILSKGHAGAIVYATLAEVGFFSVEDLNTYAMDDSKLMAHISHNVSGVEFSTGSLGHGLPFSVGKALALKRLTNPSRVFALLSDGELDEGSNWEALLFAAHHKLDHLTIIIDYNKLQSLDTVDKTLTLEPLAKKFESFGCAAKEIDGHNYTEIFKSLNSTPWIKNKPSVLIAHTIKGKGVSFMENRVEWHYKSPSFEQLNNALIEIEAKYA